MKCSVGIYCCCCDPTNEDAISSRDWVNTMGTIFFKDTIDPKAAFTWANKTSLNCSNSRSLWSSSGPICSNKWWFICSCVQGFSLRLHEQIKQRLFEQIRPGLLHTDQEFAQLKEVLLICSCKRGLRPCWHELKTVPFSAPIFFPYEVNFQNWSWKRARFQLHVNKA